MTLFRHFANNPSAIKRIRFVLGLYGITLLLCTVSLYIGYRKQDRAYGEELTRVERELSKLNAIYSQDPQTKVGDDAFGLIMNRQPMPLKDTDRMLRTGISDDLVNHNFQVTAFISTLVATRFPLVRYAPILRGWTIFAVLYWLTILYLYTRGLAPGVGEPVFNIIDVGFLGVLVKYTGGLDQSWFFVFYLFSFILAIYDFITKKDRQPLAERCWADKLALIIGPYFFALFLSTFWGTCESVLMGEQSVTEYIYSWLGIVIVTAIICVGIYVVLVNLTEDILARDNANSIH